MVLRGIFGWTIERFRMLTINVEADDEEHPRGLPTGRERWRRGRASAIRNSIQTNGVFRNIHFELFGAYNMIHHGICFSFSSLFCLNHF